MHVCFCDQCCWNGFTKEKVVHVFEGLRAETEDGFIYNFTTYNYPSYKKHEHKFNKRAIADLVKALLKLGAGTR